MSIFESKWPPVHFRLRSATGPRLPERIPAEINIEQVQRKYPVLYEESMNTVLQQEIIKYNRLLPVIDESLKELTKAIKGTVVMSDILEQVGNDMFANKVPVLWEKAPSYPSLKPLASWVVDLEEEAHLALLE